MRIMKNPYINAAVTFVISLAYATVFILTSGHIEFERILNHSQTLNRAFWNNWSIFLLQGNLKYIGYAYDNGITKGTNTENTLFSPNMELDGKMYVTFVLRALGYDDSKGDFHWETSSYDLAKSVGILTDEDIADINGGGFYRDHVVKISFKALSVELKGENRTLGQKLVADGVFTQDQLNKAFQSVQ